MELVAHTPPGEVCSDCGRRVPVAKEDKTPRKRTQLNIAVPADAENGEEVLRTLIGACRERLQGPLGYGVDTPPYYILSAVLSDWLAA